MELRMYMDIDDIFFNKISQFTYLDIYAIDRQFLEIDFDTEKHRRM